MTSEDNPPTFEPTTHAYRWAMLGGVWLVYFCFGLTSAGLAPLVKPIGDELGLSHAAMGSVMGAWPLVYIASAIPCGAFLDRVGPRRALFLAAMSIALSGVLRGLAVDHLSLFLAVAVFGVGGPLISVGAPKLIALWFAGKERGLAMGIYITGPFLGMVLAVSLTNSVMMPLSGEDWRVVLFCYAAFIAAASAAWLAISAHPASRRVERQIAAEPKRSQLKVFASLVRLPAVRIILIMSGGIFFYNHGLNNWLPEILRSGGMDIVTAGFWAAVPNAIGIVASLLIPRLAVPERRHAILLALIACAGAAALLMQNPEGPLLATGLLLQGLARGALMTIAVLLLVETRGVDSQSTGLAGGLFFSAAEIGGVLGPLSVGFLADFSGGFQAPLYMMAAVCVVLALLLARHRRVAG